jgi:hypothetical protein
MKNMLQKKLMMWYIYLGGVKLKESGINKNNGRKKEKSG